MSVPLQTNKMKRTDVDVMFDRQELASFLREKWLWKKNLSQDA